MFILIKNKFFFISYIHRGAVYHIFTHVEIWPVWIFSIYLSESKKNAPTSKGRKGAKNSATAAKVALMKLKLHATGDKGLPQVFTPEWMHNYVILKLYSNVWVLMLSFCLKASHEQSYVDFYKTFKKLSRINTEKKLYSPQTLSNF